MTQQPIGGFRLSPQQRRLWQLQSGAAGAGSFTVGCAVRVGGALEVEPLRKAVAEVTAHHEILRTTFRLLSGMKLPVQVIAEEGEVQLAEVEASGTPTRELLARLAAEPYDPAALPLLRCRLVRLSGAESLLLLSLPALCADPASLPLLAAAIGRAYAAVSGAAETPADEPVQHADLAEWQNELLEGEETEAGRGFWRRLDLSRLGMRLPVESIPDREGAFSPRARRVPLQAGAGEALAALAERAGVAPAAVLLAAWQIFLGRLADAPEIVVGTVFEGRKFAELAEAVGPLARTLPIRVSLAGDPSFMDVARRAGEALGEAHQWQEYFAWELLAQRPEDLRPGVPRFPFLFELLPAPARLDFAGFAARLEEIEGWTDLGVLKLAARLDDAGRLAAELHADPESFADDVAERLATGFATLLTAALAAPESRAAELDLLAPGERLLLEEINRTGTAFPEERCLHELFVEQAERTPLRVAVAAEGRELTFAELDELSERLAWHLVSLGVGPDVRVGLCLERSVDQVIALLAVLKAGGAYVPLDPDYPRDRLRFMVEDAAAPVLVSRSSLRGLLAGSPARIVEVDALEDLPRRGGSRLGRRAVPSNLAYVLYTSGSTGRPKGVMITHRSLVNHMVWMRDAFPLGEDDRVLQRTAFSFDASVWEFYAPLLSGARLVLDKPGNRLDADFLVRRIAEERITSLQVVPSMLRLLLAHDGLATCTDLRRVFAGGEALRPELAARFFETLGASLINLYGPTETTIECTSWVLRRGDPVVPIGRPIANTSIRLLDRRLQPVPAGAPGELYVAGAGLARGYLGRPALTAGSFLPDPWGDEPGSRMYRTGDLVRLLPDGALEYLGRANDQVKLRGFRIELGEIGAVLARHPGVEQALAVVREDMPGEQRLVAYWVARDAEPPQVGELRAFLGERLPEHMVPASFVRLKVFPLAPNGKVDRRQLPSPSSTRPDLEEEYVAPRDPDEELLAAIWSEVLGIDEIGVRDNFLSLGADSIRSVRLVALAQERGLALSLQQVFQHQTIEELAEALRQGDGRGPAHWTEPFSLVSPEDRAKVPPGIVDAYPLSSLQAGMLYHMQVDPAAPAYHNVTGFLLRARFDPAAFQAAVDRAVERHDVLRTSFDMTTYSEPLQLVHRHARLEVVVEDLRGLPRPQQDAVVDALVQREKNTPFDLSRPPLLRFFVHRLSDETFWFTLTECHSILDGWSLTSIIREVFDNQFRLLDGEGLAEEPPLTVAFRDFIHLERKALAEATHRAFWEEQLRGARLLRLPRLLGAVARPAGGVANLAVPIGAQLSEGLVHLARSAAVPVKSVCLAAHVKFLALVTGAPDVLTGLPTNGRPEHKDGERIRGLFINTVPFRQSVVEGSWMSLVKEVFTTERRLLPFRRYPLSALRQNWNDEPLFEVLFSFVHFHHMERMFQAGEMAYLEGFKGWEATNFTLLVGFNRHPPSLDLKMRLYYKPDELSDEQVAGYSGCFQRILQTMVEDPFAPHAALDLGEIVSPQASSLLRETIHVGELDQDFSF